jgi:hypothetical protein
MLLFGGQCTCISLPVHTDRTVCFFIPWDVCERYGLNRPPDYCAIRITAGGFRQPIAIIGKNGKDTLRSDSDAHHRAIKERAQVEGGIMRNVDQLPPYADVKIKNHPTLLLGVDA